MCAVVILCIVIGAVVYGTRKDNNAGDNVDLIEVPDSSEQEKVDDDGKPDDVQLHEVEDVEEKSSVDTKNFKYDPFADDAGWGDESIFGSKIIVSGTGKRDESSGGSQVIIGDSNSTSNNPNVRELSAAEARAAIMEEVKSSDYAYRINENDFSDGFGIYMNPKYDLSVGRIMGDTGYVSGPNGTEVGITELDNSLSIDEHRKTVLKDAGYRKVYDYSNGAIFEYNTPVTIGSGIDDFENTPYYVAWRYSDESMNDYGGQLFCDTTMESTFGEGYYIEMYNATSGLYYGYYIVEHNGRIFKATGMSTYRDTLLDVTLAAMDTCVYPY